MNSLSMTGPNSAPLYSDIATQENSLRDCVHESRFLVIGRVGTIGQAVTSKINAAMSSGRLSSCER